MEHDPNHYTKTAASPAARQRLRAEAEMLRRAAHPGVVQLALFEDHEHRTELATRRAGDHNLAAAPPKTMRSAVEFAASLARTVADLHDLGLAHRRLTADHVLVAAGDRPVLCGFADAADSSPEEDVRSLGSLFELLAASAPALTGREAKLSRKLLALAELARTADPPPSAGDLAASLGRLAAQSTRPGLPALPEDLLQGRSRRVVLGAGAGVVVVLVLVAGFGPRGGGQPDLAPAAAGPSPTTGAAAVPWAATGAPPVQPARVSAGGAVFDVGRADDIVVFGDWDCDGEPGAALLRPSTGTIWVFDVLAAPDRAMTGRRLAHLDGASELVATDGDDGCTSLTVRLGDGTPHVLLGGIR